MIVRQGPVSAEIKRDFSGYSFEVTCRQQLMMTGHAPTRETVLEAAEKAVDEVFSRCVDKEDPDELRLK